MDRTAVRDRCAVKQSAFCLVDVDVGQAFASPERLFFESEAKAFVKRTLSCDSHIDENPFGTGPHKIHAPLAFKLHGRKPFPAFLDEGGRKPCDFSPYFRFRFRIGSQFFRMVFKQILYLIACLIPVVERPKDLLLIGVPEDTHFGVQLQSAIDFRPFAVSIDQLPAGQSPGVCDCPPVPSA